jgi:hypothetical protein
MNIQEIKVIVDYKTKEAYNELMESKKILGEVENGDDEHKLNTWKNIVDYRAAKWSAYNDIKKTIELMQ